MAEIEVVEPQMTTEKQTWPTGWLSTLGWAVLVVALAVIIILPRSVSLGSFVTADEPTWAKRSASFFYALKEKNYAETFQTGHPGVITMWAGALAYQLKFPLYHQVGQQNLGDTKLLQIFLLHGPNPMELIAAARLVVVVLVTIFLLVTFFFARRLFGTGLAVFMFLLIAFEPLYVAHSRVLHTNGLLATFMFLSLIALIDYLRTRTIAGLVFSGIGAGLGFVCISPALALIPAVGLITLGSLWDTEKRHFNLAVQSLARRVVLPLIVWGTVSLLVVYLVWPAMWRDPVGTLSRTLLYGVSAAEGEIGGAHFVGAYQDVAERSTYLNFYPLTYLWRTTPVVLIGLGLAVLALVFHRSLIRPQVRRSLYDLIGFVVVYLLIMTVGAKKFDRYFLPAYLPLDMLAAVGWVSAGRWLAGRYPILKKTAVQFGLAGLFLAPQALSTLAEAPYYFTYFNPLMGGLHKAPQVMTVGWGEGLNEAALYLSQQPGACERRILSWYPLAYSWYSISLGCESQMVEFTPDLTLQDYLDYDYLVIYINQIQRNQPPELLAYLDSLQPVHSVRIDGVEFVRIYQLH